MTEGSRCEEVLAGTECTCGDEPAASAGNIIDPNALNEHGVFHGNDCLCCHDVSRRRGKITQYKVERNLGNGLDET